MSDLETAQSAVASLLASLEPADWSLDTPCPDWDVAAVVRHLCVGERAFATSLGGSPYDLVGLTAALAEIADADLPAAYADGALTLRGAFGGLGPFPTGLGPMDGEAIADLRTLEALVHGWDVATATGRPFPEADEVAERALPRTLSFIGRLPEGRTPFGPPQPVPDDAPALDRLVALVGRDPSAT